MDAGVVRSASGNRGDRRHGDAAWPEMRVRIFEADPRLLATVPTEAQRRLRGVTVPVRVLKPGPWVPRMRAGEPALGFLVLEGVISLQTDLFGRTAVEIMGPGDPMLPGEESDPGILSFESRWRVVTKSRLAVLAPSFKAKLRVMPDVTEALMRRTRESARALRRQHAIVGIPDVAQRLLA